MTPANNHSGEPTSDGSPTLDQRTSKGSNAIERKPLRTTDLRNTIELEPIHHQLLVAFSHSNRAMQMRTRACGLKPGQPKVLRYLSELGHSSQRELADCCDVDPSAICRMLDSLERGGFVTRSPSPRFSSRVRVSARVMDCITIRRSW